MRLNNIYIPLRSGGAARSVSAHEGSELADGGLTDEAVKSELENPNVSQERRRWKVRQARRA